MQCRCLAQSCEHDGNLIFFEIDVPLLEELLQSHRKKTINQMVVFLAQINLFLAISNAAMEFFASKAEVRHYKKGDLVLEEKDFPLAKFFIVKEGKVNLYKRVEVERANFMPTTKKTYQKRCYRKSVPHCLGHVLPPASAAVLGCVDGEKWNGSVPECREVVSDQPDVIPGVSAASGAPMVTRLAMMASLSLALRSL